MAEYDYKAAKRFIQMHSDIIESASMGMAEDWDATAETVYEDGSFTVDLDEEPCIAGITGSYWATPALDVIYKDGSEESKDCYVGSKDIEKKPEWFSTVSF